ncbi:MAG: DUF547 domain-containing protein [Erythrobacter sp.]|jgi:hypothetical protein|nr:DUF547 domain-containing protein [Erythrobacter sp.]
MVRIPFYRIASRLMLGACGGALAAASAVAQPATLGAAPDQAFATFTPGTNPNADSIDYSIWDEAMRNLVVSMGPSLRQGAPRPDQGFGSRRVYGHVSRYRLEGTRIMFSFLDAEVIATFGEYRRDLEATADKVDIQSLSRNEQLAYWINLHNVAMVEQIANNWPIRQPREIKVDGVPLDDAKFITVEGIAMSLKDIRTRIVYPNWKDPRVIYGFWRGDIGSPSIQREAFNADNVSRLLERGAQDFVNSLRGTQKSGDTLEVATIYEEAAPFYFREFEPDLRAHLARFADEDTAEILRETKRMEATISEYDIADLAGGVREPTYSYIENADTGNAISFRIPQSMQRLLAAREEKFRRILKEGRTGSVTFSNIDLPGDPKDKEVQ